MLLSHALDKFWKAVRRTAQIAKCKTYASECTVGFLTVHHKVEAVVEVLPAG